MNQFTKDKLSTLGVSEKIHRMEKLQGCTDQISLVQVQAELNLLSVELSMSIDILRKIQDSVHVLELSLGEQ